jgi:hypothetical protein
VPTWEVLPVPVAPKHRAAPRAYHRPMSLILDAPGATPEQLVRGVDVACQVFIAAGVDAREAWAAFSAGVRGEAWSTWRLAETCALEACATEGELALTDD